MCIRDSAKTRETWVHLRPQADGQWRSIEGVAPERSFAPEALPSMVVKRAGLVELPARRSAYIPPG